MGHEIRMAFRNLIRTPIFSAAAFVTLTLVFAANTSLFGVIEAVLLRPLPVRDPDRVVMLWEENAAHGLKHQRVAPAKIADWLEARSTLAGVAAFVDGRSVTVTDAVEPEHLNAALVSGAFFSIAGITTAIGRPIGPNDIALGADPAVVIDEGLWKRKFAMRANAIGAHMSIEGKTYTVVGVVSAQARFPPAAQLWLPLTDVAWSSRSAHMLSAIARLSNGVTLTQAQAAMYQLASNLAALYPASDYGWTVRIVPIRDELLGAARPTLLLLMTTALLMLLLACVNIANLFFARAWIRQRQTAIRLAVGATRLRIALSAILEGVELTIISAICGLLLGMSIERLVTGTVSAYPATSAVEAALHVHVAVYALLLALVAGASVTAFPALHFSRLEPERLLRETGRSVAGSWQKHPVVGSLVVVQVMLALPLVTAAVIFAADLMRLDRATLGFDPQRVLTARIALPRSPYAVSTRRIALAADLVERLRREPDAAAVGITSALPLSGSGSVFRMHLPAESQEVGHADEPIEYRTATPGYFGALGIPLIAGRSFDDGDQLGRPLVYMVNTAAVEKFWPHESPLGQRVSLLGSEGPSGSIVGVVADVRHFGLDMAPRPELYAPYAQDPWPTMSLAVKTRSDPFAFVPRVRAALREVDATLPAFDVQTMQHRVDAQLAQPRMRTVVSIGLAVLATVLTVVGVFGLVWGTVRESEGEMAIRSALGASPSTLVWLAVRPISQQVTIGLGFGVVAAYVTSRAAADVAFHEPDSTVAMGAVLGVTLLVSVAVLIAAAIPARRAAAVDPGIAIRT